MITLIFARRYFYINYNQGMIPCGEYDGPGLPRLPYQIAAHSSVNSVSLSDKYSKQVIAKILSVQGDLPQQMEFNQYVYVSHGFSDKLLEQIQSTPLNFIQDANCVFGLLEYLLPMVKAAFRGMSFKFHSATLNESARDLGCDDPTFGQHLDDRVFNNSENLVRVHVPLENSEKWMQIYPGNKTLSLNVLRGKGRWLEHCRYLPSKKGAVLVTTGAFMYSRVAKVPTIELTFTSQCHIPSYIDMFRVTDTFALSLPKKLGKLLRYENIFVTQPQYKNFKYSWLFGLVYRIYNFLCNLRMNNRLLAIFITVLVVFLLFPALPFAFVYMKTKHPVATMLEYA